MLEVMETLIVMAMTTTGSAVHEVLQHMLLRKA